MVNEQVRRERSIVHKTSQRAAHSVVDSDYNWIGAGRLLSIPTAGLGSGYHRKRSEFLSGGR